MELNMNKFSIAEIIEYIESYVDCAPRQYFGFLTVSDVKENLMANQFTFGDALIDLLKEKNVTDPECYKTMGITSGSFNKIINNRVKPTRETVALIALSLRLNIEEFDDLVNCAGYCRNNNIHNVLNIVGYCIEQNEYDIDYIEDIVHQITNKYLRRYTD